MTSLFALWGHSKMMAICKSCREPIPGTKFHSCLKQRFFSSTYCLAAWKLRDSRLGRRTLNTTFLISLCLSIPFLYLHLNYSLFFHIKSPFQKALAVHCRLEDYEPLSKFFPKPEEASIVKLCIGLLRRATAIHQAEFLSYSLLVDTTAKCRYKEKLFPKLLRVKVSILSFTLAKETRIYLLWKSIDSGLKHIYINVHWT